MRLATKPETRNLQSSIQTCNVVVESRSKSIPTYGQEHTSQAHYSSLSWETGFLVNACG
jgi:hypothetical protein